MHRAENQTPRARVKDLFGSLIGLIETAPIPPEAEALQMAYLEAGIISDRSEDDALHVAIATTARCAVLASWNYKHIVHFEKSPRYNAVNTLHGWPPVAIHAPSEVLQYEQGF